MAATKSGAGAPSENVQVAVRCRPMSSTEKSDDRQQCVRIDSARATVDVQGAAGQRGKSFTFDHTFGADSKQVRVIPAAPARPSARIVADRCACAFPSTHAVPPLLL
mgnify:FL=1|jgi:hypothetical protein